MKYKKSNKKLWIILFAVVALVVTATVFVVSSSGANEGYRTICVIEVSGKVSVVKDGIEYRAYQGMMLQEGYEIVTMGNSYVRMVLDNDKYVKLESGSKVIIEKLGMLGSRKTHINLQRGALTSEIVKPLGEDDEFIVNTPNAILSVRGTFFRVDLNATDKGEIMAWVMTYGGKVSSNRVLPDGSIVDEDVLINSGYKACINMTENDTYYVLETENDLVNNPTVAINADDITDEDMIDIFYSAENGHELFVSADEAKSYIEERELNIEEYKSVYDKANEVIMKLEYNKSNTTNVDVVANDSKPIVMKEDEENIEDLDMSQQTVLVTDGDAHVHIEKTITVEPTCIEKGKKTIICKDCGKVLSDTEIEALGHKYSDEYEVDKKVTCTENGIKSKHCTRDGCGDKYDEVEIFATGHTYTSWKQIVLPTCEQTGVNERECSQCNYTESKIIDKLEHKYSDEYTVDKEPTCTEDGTKSRHCTKEGCVDKIDVIELTATGHTYICDIVEATCTKDGTKTYTCDCGYTYTEKISAKGHTEIYVGTKDCHKKCSVCGLETEHLYTVDVISKLSCTTDGLKKYTCSCGYAYTEELKALGHTEVDGATIDCHTKCETCGEVLVDGSGHSFETNIVTNPTCTAEGEQHISCECGYDYNEPIDALGHSEVNGADIDCHTKCETCGEVLVDGSGHSFETNVVTNPTCTVEGEQHISCECGYDYNEPIDALGHAEVDGAAVDCHTKCETCGEVLVDGSGHSFETNVVTNPTCTVEGEQHVSCECGYDYNEPVAALGHEKTDENADVTTCKHCGKNWVDINSNVFPDSSFLAYVAQFDTDNDNCLIGSEITDITSINVSGTESVDGGYTDLSGIENFTELQALVCSYNSGMTGIDLSGLEELSTLDIDECTGLTSINVSGTSIGELDLTTNTSLQTLNAYGSDIKTIDATDISTLTSVNVANAGGLMTLKLKNTGIYSIDLSGTHTVYLDVSGTQITYFGNLGVDSVEDTLAILDISNTAIDSIDLVGLSLDVLTELYADNAYIDDMDIYNMISIDPNYNKLQVISLKNNTEITGIDVSACLQLRGLDVSGTGITDLDLTNNANLENLYVNNISGMTELNLEGYTSLRNLQITNNVDLEILDVSGTNIESFNANTNKSLVTIDLSDCTQLTSFNMDDGLTENYAVESINISGCTMLLQFNINGCPNLTSLDFSASTNLKSVGINYCTGLTGELDFSGNSNLDVLNIQGSEAITSLNLTGATSLTNVYLYDVTTESGIIDIIVTDTNLTESNFVTNGTVTVNLIS